MFVLCFTFAMICMVPVMVGQNYSTRAEPRSTTSKMISVNRSVLHVKFSGTVIANFSGRMFTAGKLSKDRCESRTP